jgi:hypothetical protein
VKRNNNSVKDCLEGYAKTNQTAIKKLANPSEDAWVEVHFAKNGIEGMETAEGFMQTY